MKPRPEPPPHQLRSVKLGVALAALMTVSKEYGGPPARQTAEEIAKPSLKPTEHRRNVGTSLGPDMFTAENGKSPLNIMAFSRIYSAS